MNLEKVVLGGFLQLRKEVQAELISELRSDLFVDSKNRDIYHAYVSILAQGKTIDAVSLYTELKGTLLPKELTEIMDTGVGMVDYNKHLDTHIKLLREAKYKKDVENTVGKALEEIKTGTHHDDVDEVKQGLILDLSKMDLNATTNFINYDLMTDKLLENIDKNTGRIEGYSWGISQLDEVTNGITRPHLYICGALKKAGKTRFLMHVRRELYRQGCPTVMLQLEMPDYSVSKITASTFTSINEYKLRAKSLLKRSEREVLSKYKSRMDFSKIPTECIAGVDVSQVVSKIRAYAQMFPKTESTKPDVVIMIDYVQRILHNEDRQAQELERICKAIADATRQFNCTIILLSQLKNESETREPNTGDLKGSGGIAETADTIMIIDNVFRRTKQESDRGLTHISVEQRYGEGGKFTCYADLGICLYKDLHPDVIAKAEELMEKFA